MGDFSLNKELMTSVSALLHAHNVKIHGSPVSLTLTRNNDRAHFSSGLSSTHSEPGNVTSVKNVSSVAAEIDPKSENFGKQSTVGRGSRTRTTKLLRSSLLAGMFCSTELCAVSRKYIELSLVVPEGRKRASVIKTAQYVHRYYSFCITMGTEPMNVGTKCRVKDITNDLENDTFWRVLTQVCYIDAYIADLKQVFRIVTVKNHAQEVIRFLQDSSSLPALSKLVPISLRQARSDAIEVWRTKLSILQKGFRVFQKRRMICGEFERCSFLAISNYMREESVLDQVKKSLNRIKGFLYDGNFTGCGLPAEYSEAWLSLVRFLVVSVLTQGMRHVVICNLKTKEFEAASPYGSVRVVRVADHKTCSVYGAATIVLSGLKYDYWREYCCLRLKLRAKPGSEEFFFINGCGSQITASMLEDLNRYLISQNCSAVSHTTVRKNIETLSQLFASDIRYNGRNGDGSNVTRAVQTYLCHSSSVTNDHYAYRTDEVVVSQYSIENHVVHQSIAQELITDQIEELIPEDYYEGEKFPTKEQLLRRIYEKFPNLGLTIDTLSCHAYRQAEVKWAEKNACKMELYLIQKFRSMVMAGDVHNVQNLARDFVFSLPPVWVSFKSDFLAKVFSSLNFKHVL